MADPNSLMKKTLVPLILVYKKYTVIFCSIAYSSFLCLSVLGPVENLSIDVETSNSLTLSWDPQTQSKCDTDEYSVEYELVVKDQCESVSDPDRVVFGSYEDEFVIVDNLQPFSTYSVFVVPINGIGRGGESFLMSSTTESGNIVSMATRSRVPFFKNFYTRKKCRRRVCTCVGVVVCGVCFVMCCLCV